MADAFELDALWEEFHRVVNMTSQELAAWLQVREAAEPAHAPESGEAPPGARTPGALPEVRPPDREPDAAVAGQQVLEILQKRRIDLTDEDAEVMYLVVDTVDAEADAAHGPDPESARRRRRLMALGHDPLRS